MASSHYVLRSLVAAVLLTMIACASKENGVTNCNELRFSDGSRVWLQKDKIHEINALMEWPRKLIFSISIVLPSSSALGANADIERILLLPTVSTLEAQSGVICAKLAKYKNRSSCQIILHRRDLSTIVVFGDAAADSLKETTEEIAEYLAQQVLNCTE